MSWLTISEAIAASRHMLYFNLRKQCMSGDNKKNKYKWYRSSMMNVSSVTWNMRYDAQIWYTDCWQHNQQRSQIPCVFFEYRKGSLIRTYSLPVWSRFDTYLVEKEKLFKNEMDKIYFELEPEIDVLYLFRYSNAIFLPTVSKWHTLSLSPSLSRPPP